MIGTIGRDYRKRQIVYLCNCVDYFAGCFVDDLNTARDAMSLGFYISISGIVTFKSAQDLRDVAVQIPLDRLLVETDSPWLAPVPHRGKQNEPAYVTHTASYLAELRGISPATLAEATSENFFRLFTAAA